MGVLMGVEGMKGVVMSDGGVMGVAGESDSCGWRE
jgi:hypothetical protein